MSRTVYVNGEFVPEEEAKISVFDRAFLMADGVYEVTSVLDGKLIDFPGHMARLHRSLNELKMKPARTDDELLAIHRELIARNDLESGMIYLQITRGAADRDFIWPTDAEPGIVLFTQAKEQVNAATAKTGLKVITVEDQRWARRDIKTVQLLFPSFAKMEAKAAGKDDAWLVTDGEVNEGTSNNAYIVKNDVIITRNLSNDILHGITRAAVLRFAREAQMKVEERAFTVEEAKAADEAFCTSASAFVTAIVEIDGATISAGEPGPIAARLREVYIDESRKTAI
ncbi:D-amino-acid transaminase [Pikeienuella piscinae]|uniref:Probable branched-chain-amino-acid aminotransferase n=1 Tax=Pikeienuella piscinae TaxID=2748098 RepID=A0A7L5BXL4_9RHOB|nr:D-amino-acid transaminase [Pikeienuella piscinae]QIE56472.1 D-amino-acid transaminase [Pikeienuella piscinae]